MDTFLALLFVATIFIWIVAMLVPSLFNRFFKVPPTRKKLSKIFLLASLAVFGLFALTSGSKPKDNSNTKQEVQETTTLQEVDKDLDYEVVGSEELSTVENYWVLVKSGQTKEALEDFIREFKKDKCKKPCNVSLYDEKRAAELDIEYKKLTTMEAQNSWKEKNYIYVADHLVGWMSFDSDSYWEYPYKDWYYKELKAK